MVIPSAKLLPLLLLFLLFIPSASPLAFNYDSFTIGNTGKIADFTTHFTFMIDSGHADGMVFFIAPSGSLLNISAGGGGHLGLPVEEQPGDTTRTLYPFVAVEFDIYRNEQPAIRDPVGDHVGIDINSLKSNITTPWNGDICWIMWPSGHIL
ncbi:hypothetical protein ACFX2I_030804 [Malus domestica]